MDCTPPVRIKSDPRQPLILVVSPAVVTIIDVVAQSLGADLSCDKCNRPLYIPVITSGLEGVHGAGSDHHRNQAVDFRSKDWPRNEDALLRTLKEKLPAGYRYLMEGDHLHVERHNPADGNVT